MKGKVAINCAFFQPRGGGVKEYIHNLVSNLVTLADRPEIVVYVLRDQLDYARKELPAGIKIKVIPFDSGSKLNRIKRSLFERKFWLKEEKDEGFDIFHSPFFHAPRLRKAKVLLTVHDLRLYRFPETYEFFRYQFLKRKVRDSIKRADHIISISDFTADEIKELCGVGKEKVTVIHEAINPERFSIRENYVPEDTPKELLGKPYLLSVGHMEPRKNYDRLIEAFKIIKKKPEFKDLKLVIVGKKDHSFKKTLQLIEDTPDVMYLNFVTGDLLMWLYKNARLFVFPSYYEGFGFPPLEAASLGTSSAVSNVSSIPEVCGEAAFYFDSFSIEDMTKVIDEAISNEGLLEEMEKKAKNRLEVFSWRRNAEETLKVYQSLAGKE